MGPLVKAGPIGSAAGMPFAIRPFHPDDATWLVARHGALYAEHEGFDASFPALVDQIVQAFVAGHNPAREAGWIATKGAQRMGSIFCVTESAKTPQIAKLRLFLLEPTARGTGLSQRMLETCMTFAKDAGYEAMRLWTHESHRAAGRLYARNGFALLESTPTRSFGQDVVSQIWFRVL